MRVSVLAAYLLLVPVLSAESPSSAVSAALRDCAARPIDAPHTRYLSLYNVPVAGRAELVKVMAFHANMLSREFEIVRPRRVNATLLAVDLRWYGWSPDVWEKLRDADPYFHVETLSEVYEGKGYYARPGDTSSWVWTKKELKKVRRFDHAPWLEANEIGLLAKLTHSDVPVVRADWFLYQTAIQKDRAAGYYEWLGIKDRKTFEELVGLDRKLAQRVRREVAAIVADSGVTLQNRQIFRFGIVTGGYWESRDVADGTGDGNALRNLDGAFVREAEEIFATLPNGLFAYALFNADGVRQDTAPDTIASDSSSTSNDARVHVGLSCVRCHVEGLRPINDWARKTFAKTALASPDYETARRLNQLYLSPLDDWLDRDVSQYAAALKACNGMTPAENAKAFGAAWEAYADDLVTPGIAAAELGVGEVEFVEAVRAMPPLSDPVLASFAADPPVPIRREAWEEVFGAAMLLAGGREE